MPINLNVISADASFLRTLGEESFQAKVHSVFTHVINIQSANGTLYTLACCGCDNAPNTALVDVGEFPADWFVQEEICTNMPEKSALNFPCISVDFHQAMTWECVLPAWSPSEFHLETKISLLEKVLEQQRDLIFKPQNSQGKAEQFLLGALTLLYQRADQLFNALMREELSAAADHAVSMIGLGPGLTPSGDDFLVGLFAVLNVRNSPAHRFHGLCTAVLEHAEGLTNQISLAALKSAAHGQVRQSIVDLFHALFCETDNLDSIVLSRVLDIGSTSGADILTGMHYGLKLIVAPK